MPKFKIYHTDSLGKDFVVRDTWDAEDAALEYVEIMDKAENEITENTVLTTENLDTGEVKVFEVTGEVEVNWNYKATEKSN